MPLYCIRAFADPDPDARCWSTQNFPVNMSSLIAIKKPISQINFQVQMLNVNNQLVDPTFIGTVYIAITFTLIRLKKYDNDYVKLADNR